MSHATGKSTVIHGRRLGAYLVAGIAILPCLALPAAGQSLRTFHMDAEQGDATLFVAPSGGTLLVDSGKKRSRKAHQGGDASGQAMSLASLDEIAPGQSLTIRRDGAAMSLYNNGDTITFFGPSNSVVDSVTYGSSSEGSR